MGGNGRARALAYVSCKSKARHGMDGRERQAPGLVAQYLLTARAQTPFPHRAAGLSGPARSIPPSESPVPVLGPLARPGLVERGEGVWEMRTKPEWAVTDSAQGRMGTFN